MPLNVCIDARLGDGSHGGIQQFMIGLASGLSGLADGSEIYTFLTHAGADSWLRPHLGNNCRVLAVPPPSSALAKRLPATLVAGLRRAKRSLASILGRSSYALPQSDGTIERAGVEIMHFTFQAAFLTRVPSIYHPHDLQHVHLPELFSRTAIRARDIHFKAFCDQAAMVAVAAQHVKCDLIEHYRIPGEKIAVIPLAPVVRHDPLPTDDDLNAAVERYHLPGLFIYYPAQTWRHKNHLGLIQALVWLRDQANIRVDLICSGKLYGEHYPAIARFVAKSGMEDQVKFLGFVSPLERQCLYHLCRAVVIPTRFEAASFPMWEAFALGAPVACSNVTSLPEQAGGAAIIFSPDDPEQMAQAIRQVVFDDVLRRRLIERGRERVSQFTWDRTARIFRAHYRRIGGRPLSEDDQALLSQPAAF